MADLRLAENRVVRGDWDVAPARQPRGCTDAPAAHRADDRLGILPTVELAPENIFAVRVAKPIVLVDQRCSLRDAIRPGGFGVVAADIFAGGKRASRSGNHHRTNLRIGLGFRPFAAWSF